MPKRNRYEVSALRRDYYIVNIEMADGSKHLIGGFATKASAKAWVEEQRQKIATDCKSPTHRLKLA